MKRQKGLLADRVADCSSYHFNYCRDCYPEPAAGADCGERSVGRSVDSDTEHSADFIQLRLPDGGLFEHAGQSLGQLRGNHCADLDERLLDR